MAALPSIVADLARRWDLSVGEVFQPGGVIAWVAAVRSSSRAGIELLRSLPASATREVLLCTDLHAGNVLAAEREPWLVIDPKPHVGDPTFDAPQHLLSCPGRLSADPVGLVRRLASLLEVDHDRLRLWLFARCVQQSPSWPWLAGVARRLAP